MLLEVIVKKMVPYGLSDENKKTVQKVPDSSNGDDGV